MMCDAIPSSEDNDMKPPLDPQTAALARKRRIELRKRGCSSKGVVSSSSSNNDDLDSDSCAAERKRARVSTTNTSSSCSDDDDEEVDDGASTISIDPITKKPRPSITGIKKHSRYDPGVPMTRDELKMWRKEARRVRNRESAAASRKRNRERITELETEMSALRSKYSAALQRIVQLEASGVNDSFTPAVLRQDINNLSSSPSTTTTIPETATTSPPLRPTSPEAQDIKTVSPPLSPSIPEYQHYVVDEEEQLPHEAQVNMKYQHIMNMISRPIACVTIY